MKAQEAWDELKSYISAAEQNFREMSEKLSWTEQTDDNTFSDILRIMYNLEKKHE